MRAREPELHAGRERGVHVELVVPGDRGDGLVDLREHGREPLRRRRRRGHEAHLAAALLEGAVGDEGVQVHEQPKVAAELAIRAPRGGHDLVVVAAEDHGLARAVRPPHPRDNPGVTVPEMSVEEAMDYIFSVGLTVAGLPGSMAFARHQTLKGHLIYIDTEHLGDQGAKDIITVLKAVTGHTSSRGDTPGLPEAAARLLLARGERSRDTIRRCVRDIAGRIIEWASTYDDPSFPWKELWGIQEVAVRLHRDLVLEGTTVLP